MYIRSLFTACVAVVLCATLVETAEAYPTTARSGTTTVTGTYRPLDFEMIVVPESGELDYAYGGGPFSFFATYNGTYTGVGYDIPLSSATSGDWRFTFFATATDDGNNTITVSDPDATTSLGRLTYLGGGDYEDVPYRDKPQQGDFFRLFAPSNGPFMQVECADGAQICSSFVLTLLQTLRHVGPYVDDGDGSFLDDGTGCLYDSELDECVPRPESRVNPDCTPLTSSTALCGVTLNASSAAAVPEPASLALVGLGLVALAMGRRRRRAASRPA